MTAGAGLRRCRGAGAWLLASLVAAGCATGTASTAAPAGAAMADEDCTGISVLVVHNYTDHTVSIVEGRRSVNTSLQFAQVGPGTREFTVPGEAEYYYRVLPPQGVSIQEQRRITRGGGVRLTRECRPADGRAL